MRPTQAVVQRDNVVSLIAGWTGRNGGATGKPEELGRGGRVGTTAIRGALSDLAWLYMLGFP
ncbi:MAG: hypothetical protein MUF06_18300 [Pirellulaceae bacterium]|nr:hypothetical protein [Pirellulaceae bacterium]